MKWEQITIKKYQDIYKVYNTEKDVLRKKIKILAILTDKDVSYYDNLQLKELAKDLNELSFLDHLPTIDKPKKYIKVRGQRFKVNYDLSTFTSGMFIDMTKLAESEQAIIKNLPSIMAVVCEPINFFGKTIKMDFDKKSEILQDAFYVDSNNVAAFFLLTLLKLPAAIQRYSIEVLEREKGNILKSLPKHLRSIGDGLPQ